MSPARAWRRAIRDPDPKTREVLWTRLQRDKEIRGLDREETAREVLALLQDPDAGTRLQAVTTLSLIESDPLEAIPRLTDRLADPDVEVRARAASALGDVFKRKGPGRDEAIEAISTALKDRTALVRAAAVSSLGQVIYESGESADPLRSGRADDPALTLVENRLKDDDAGREGRGRLRPGLQQPGRAGGTDARGLPPRSAPRPSRRPTRPIGPSLP